MPETPPDSNRVCPLNSAVRVPVVVYCMARDAVTGRVGQWRWQSVLVLSLKLITVACAALPADARALRVR